jgi:hypothetical protein
MTDEDYQSALRRLVAECPTLGRPLAHANKIRTERLQFFLDNTGRLEGLDTFSAFLDAATKWFREFPELNPITFLLARAGADFVTAVEATISGFHAVAWESMRDVMEIELLLAEFTDDPAQMEKWRTASKRVRRNVFSHGELRKRKAMRLGLSLSELPDTVDYGGHSTVLHVNPVRNPFGNRGLSRSGMDVGSDACFWDIYQHAQNLFKVILDLFGKFGESREVEGWKPPSIERFIEEYREVMEIQEVIMDKLKELESEDADVDNPTAPQCGE